MLKKINAIKVIIYLSMFFLSILILNFFLRQDLNPKWDKNQFERDIWLSKASKMPLDNPRALMADDLKKIILREKMSRERIIYFLGEPDLLNAQERDNPSLLRYYLGEPCVGTSICQLEIKLSPDNLVTSVVFH